MGARVSRFQLIRKRRAITTDTPADVIASSFEQLVDAIERRDRCHRVEALQRAIDENPSQFDEYCRAFA